MRAYAAASALTGRRWPRYFSSGGTDGHPCTARTHACAAVRTQHTQSHTQTTQPTQTTQTLSCSPALSCTHIARRACVQSMQHFARERTYVSLYAVEPTIVSSRSSDFCRTRGTLRDSNPRAVDSPPARPLIYAAGTICATPKGNQP